MANYHTSNSRECMGVNGQPLQLHTGHIFLLQVTQESVSGTVMHTGFEHAMKSKAHMIKSLSP